MDDPIFIAKSEHRVRFDGHRYFYDMPEDYSDFGMSYNDILKYVKNKENEYGFKFWEVWPADPIICPTVKWDDWEIRGSYYPYLYRKFTARSGLVEGKFAFKPSKIDLLFFPYRIYLSEPYNKLWTSRKRFPINKFQDYLRSIT